MTYKSERWPDTSFLGNVNVKKERLLEGAGLGLYLGETNVCIVLGRVHFV